MPNYDLEKQTFHSKEFHEIIDDAVDFLIKTPTHPLPLDDSFAGGEVYLLYYKGDYKLYKKLSKLNQKKFTTPIYVGKAVPPGWRQSRSVKSTSQSLYRRISEHSRSIESVENLNIDDFYCKFMILIDIESNMISIVEAALIRKFRPLWNSVVDGFGNHDPGKNRYDQILAGWDTLHPGRSWEKKWRGPKPKISELEKLIRKSNL